MATDLDLSSLLDRTLLLYGRERGVVCGGLSWTYEGLFEEARALAAVFSAQGLRPGDRVALLHRNCHRFLQATFAAVFGGHILVPLNLRLDPTTLRRMLEDSGAKLLLAEEEHVPLAREAANGLRRPPAVRRVDRLAAPRRKRWRPRRPAAGAVAQIYYTSGTTGRPRGVTLLHRNIASHALMAIAELGLTDADVWAHVAPMFHLADAWAVFAITGVGGLHVMFPDFEPVRVLDGFDRHRVTITNLVPTMLARLVAVPGLRERRFSLRMLLSGGAPIARVLVDRLIETFRTDYVQTYGLTETSPFLTFSTLKRPLRSLPEAERRRFLARTGRPALGVELRVVDDRGREVPRDDRAVGEIRVRAPWVTPGYWRRPNETAAAFEDGWFKTGDLATWDREGTVNIVDRKKDVILTGGEKVFSIEVERALAEHPAVSESAVVGVPDPDWGERVTAVIVLREGRRATGEELAAHLKGRIASFKVPKRFVFAGRLPKTGSGKIQKGELRESLSLRAGGGADSA